MMTAPVKTINAEFQLTILSTFNVHLRGKKLLTCIFNVWKIVRVTLKIREFVSQRPESSLFLSKFIFYFLFEPPVQNFESPIVS